MNDAKGLTMGVTPPMTGKTVLITGGTGGIGRAADIGLASMGAWAGTLALPLALIHSSPDPRARVVTVREPEDG